MKKSLLILAMLYSLLSYGQEIAGDWNGILKVQGIQLRLVFHITQTDDGYSSTMDSPDQGAFGIPVTSTTFESPSLVIQVANLGVEYQGTLGAGDTISGTFKQSGLSIPLDLTRGAVEKDIVIRPQEPSEPYPYHAEEVRFENTRAGIVLAGTLTLPRAESIFPAVILISGSGPQNRDEEVFGHKPFLVLSDHLTRNGIAVLRFDERGIGNSEGDFNTANSLDLASDVESALKYLLTRKEINHEQTGLIGHSEGGIIAPMVANNSENVDFIVLLAGTGVRGDRLILMQQELLLRANGIDEQDIELAQIFTEGSFQIIFQNENTAMLQTELTDYYKQNQDNIPNSLKPQGMDFEEIINLQVAQLTSPWMVFFLKYDPVPALEKVKCPVLAINGEKDLQVPPEINLEAIRSAIRKGGNKNVTVRELPGLNHMFQECETGTPNEYSVIEQTFSPSALTEITDWILQQVE